MWVFTQDGFISAVDNNHVPGKLSVRARDKVSLTFLADITNQEITQSENSDYPYRVYVTREEFSDFLATHVDALDYSNFKNRVAVSRGSKFAAACSKVWSAMLSVTDKDAVGTGLYS
jgi:hypothetical protein